MPVHRTEVLDTRSIHVRVDENGFIFYEDQRLSQHAAIALAYKLTDAVERSIDRNQRATPSYHSSESILRRMESPLGKAKQALLNIYGGVE